MIALFKYSPVLLIQRQVSPRLRNGAEWYGKLASRHSESCWCTTTDCCIELARGTSLSEHFSTELAISRNGDEKRSRTSATQANTRMEPPRGES